MKKQLLIIQDLLPKQLKKIKELASDYDTIQSIEEIDINSLEIIFGWSAELIPLIEDEQSNVQWIQFPFAGVEHLPLKLFKEKKILLTNGSGTNAHSVVESTIGLILGITRNIVEASKNQTAGKWIDDNERYDLYGKTMLIVGAGKIGTQLGRVAQAFDMKTMGINRSGRAIEYMDEQYLQTDLADIIDQADILVNILPATPSTNHLFDATLFSKMKESAIFVNVGRGETVHTDDLLAALDHGDISWAALDVFEEEPLPTNHPLWSHEKVLITPHIAGQLEDQTSYILPIFLENLQAFINNQKIPRNFVDLESGY